MQLYMLLVAAALCCVVSAGWIRQLVAGGSGDNRGSWIAKETSTAAKGCQVGWTPKPTLAPGASQPEGEHVLDLLLRREDTSNWTNSVTCGWMSGASSSPWTCDDNSTCATNEDHIVACVSGTLSDFYSVCLNYAAYELKSCENDASGTGCCTNTIYDECATYLWTDSPSRSMYRCAKSATIITMLDEPGYIYDAAHQSQQTAANATLSPDSDNTDNNADTTQPPNDPSSANIQVGKDDNPPVYVNKLAVIVACSILGGLISMYVLYTFVISPCLRRRRMRDQQDEEIRDRLDAVFDPVASRASASNPPSSLPTRHATRVRGPPGTHTYSAAPTDTHSPPSSPTRQFPPYQEPPNVSFDNTPQQGPPPEYSILNPYPDAAPLVASTSGSERREVDSDGDLELERLPSRPRATSGFRAGESCEVK